MPNGITMAVSTSAWGSGSGIDLYPVRRIGGAFTLNRPERKRKTFDRIADHDVPMITERYAALKKKKKKKKKKKAKKKNQIDPGSQ